MPLVRSGTCRNAINERYGRAFVAGHYASLFAGWAAFLDASVLLLDTRCHSAQPRKTRALLLSPAALCTRPLDDLEFCFRRN